MCHPACSAQRHLAVGQHRAGGALLGSEVGVLGERLAELSGLPPASPELLALVKLSSEIVERVVWEVVPDLAETIIREHLHELAAKRVN